MPKIKKTQTEEIIETVKRNIESRCAYFGLKTDQQISEKLHMPKSTYADRRTRPRGWTLEQIARLSVTLRCTPQWLFTDHSGQEDI